MNTDDVRAAYLVAYDTQLRTEAETRWAQSVTRLGPLWLCRRPGNGFITYRNLAGMADLNDLVRKALATFATDPDVIEVEWKTRGHDHAPGLADALAAHGFVAGEPESIMIGEAAGLDVPIALPPGVTVRAVTAPEDVRAASCSPTRSSTPRRTRPWRGRWRPGWPTTRRCRCGPPSPGTR